jgi:hypothetical protein
MQVNSEKLLIQNSAEKESWNLLNISFAVFIFFAVAYPMPIRSNLGYISPLIVLLLGLFLILNLVRFQTVFYWNTYVFNILMVFLLLVISDHLCALFFSPIQQLLYLAARLATIVIILAGLSFFPSLLNLRRIIKIYLWSITILSLLTIAEGASFIKFGTRIGPPRTYFGMKIPFNKASGFDMSDGEFGIMVAPAFLYLLIQFFSKSGLKPLMGRIFMTITIGLALLVSQSRSAWLGLVLSIMAVIFMLPKKKTRKLLLFCAAVLGIVLLLTNIFSFILKGFTGEGPYKKNVFSRLNAYLLGWDYFKRNPLIGVGHGNATFMVFGRNIVIHNQIIDQLASAGILGIIPLLALYIIFFRTALRLYRDAKDNKIRVLTIWITASMVHALTELMLYRGFYSEHLPWYFAVLGILYSIQYGYKEVILKDKSKTSLISVTDEG